MEIDEIYNYMKLKMQRKTEEEREDGKICVDLKVFLQIYKVICYAMQIKSIASDL